MRVIVINTGTELLLGDVLNSHLAFIGREIFPVGLRVDRQLSVPDGLSIHIALAESVDRAEIIFVTGGLGPTTDDMTREVTAEFLGLKLFHDAAIIVAHRHTSLVPVFSTSLFPTLATESLRTRRKIILGF